MLYIIVAKVEAFEVIDLEVPTMEGEDMMTSIRDILFTAEQAQYAASR